MIEDIMAQSQLYIDEENAPHEFLCPISREIMRNPVITVDGYTFENQVIEKWFKENSKSPITGLRIEKKTIQNRALKEAIKYHNERDKKANQNAQKLIQTAIKYIETTIPDLINDAGLVDLDKLIAISIQNIQLKKTLKQVAFECKRYDERAEVGIKPCENCLRSRQTNRNIMNILKRSQNVMEAAPIIKQVNVEAKQFQYLPISVNELKKIDFCQLKKENWKAKFFKSYGIEKCSLETLVKRIRNLNKIPETHFTQIWRTTAPVAELFDTIKKQLAHQKCTYSRKIMQIGTRILDTKIAFDQLELKPGQYLIIEHGTDSQYVFRGQNVKCQYCYDLKPQKIKCQCESVSYCSMRCGEKNKEYHVKRCPFGKEARLEEVALKIN